MKKTARLTGVFSSASRWAATNQQPLARPAARLVVAVSGPPLPWRRPNDGAVWTNGAKGALWRRRRAAIWALGGGGSCCLSGSFGAAADGAAQDAFLGLGEVQGNTSWKNCWKLRFSWCRQGLIRSYFCSVLGRTKKKRISTRAETINRIIWRLKSFDWNDFCQSFV